MVFDMPDFADDAFALTAIVSPFVTMALLAKVFTPFLMISGASIAFVAPIVHNSPLLRPETVINL